MLIWCLAWSWSEPARGARGVNSVSEPVQKTFQNQTKDTDGINTSAKKRFAETNESASDSDSSLAGHPRCSSSCS